MEISKNTLEALSEARLEEAKLLLSSERYSGAYYIAGYSVELALKACIAKNFRSGVLPDRKFVLDTYTHNLTQLVGVAGLGNLLEREIKINRFFAGNWGVVKEWDEQARYAQWDAARAMALIEAISDSKHGVLQWLRRHY